MIVIFRQPILFANAVAFFCSLLGLVSDSFPAGHSSCEEIGTRASKRSITHAILRLY